MLPLKITNGELEQFQTGDTLDILNGGTGATTVTQARTNLGVAIGSDVQAYSSELAALAAMAATGIIARTAANTYAQRTLTGVAGRISVTNGDGVSGNPTFDLATLADGGTGSFLKFTRDTYGRVSGTTAVVAADISSLVDTRYLQLSGGTLTNFLTLHADPTSAMHAVTKQYADAIASGMKAQLAVRVASTANVTIASPGTAIDGVTLSNGDRVLLKNQTTASQNGVYVFNGSGSAMTRATDADAGNELPGGSTFWVNEGSAQGDTAWTLVSDGAITIGSTSLTFTQTSGLGQVVAGNGLTKTGNTLDIGTASSTRIVVNADNIDLASGVIASPGTFTKVTVDTYGRVTVGATATASDVGAQPSDAGLTALAALTGAGAIFATATDTYVMRTLTGTSGRIAITNGDGVAGNPTFDLVSGIVSPGTYNSVTVDTYGRVTAGVNNPSSGSNLTATNGEASAIAIGRAVYVSAADTVKLANANAAGTKQVVGLVFDTSINAAASGSIAVAGVVTATTTQWDAVTGQTGGLTSGAKYFLSNTTAGALTTTAPTTGYIAPVGVALSTTKMVINVERTVKL
jgi:hypothetical protein